MGIDLLREAEVGEGAELWIDAQDDVPAFAAVASVGTAARDVRLAPEGDDAAAAIPSADHQAYAIDEHVLQTNERPWQSDDPKMPSVGA